MAISRFSTSSVAQGLPKYQKLWDGTSAVFDSDYELIERVNVGAGGSSSISFSSIPSTYRHLQVRAFHRATTGAGDGTIFMRFNSDSGSNYSSHRLYGYGGSLGSDSSVNATAVSAGHSMGATPSLQGFSVMINDILDYANASKYKTVRSLAGTDLNGDASGAIFFNSGNWRSNSTITSITITTNQTSFAQYSTFALYGIKGAS